MYRFIKTKKVESPDIAMGIHPGLHAEGVYEFWEPTLLLLLRHYTTPSKTTFRAHFSTSKTHNIKDNIET